MGVEGKLNTVARLAVGLPNYPMGSEHSAVSDLKADFK